MAAVLRTSSLSDSAVFYVTPSLMNYSTDDCYETLASTDSGGGRYLQTMQIRSYEKQPERHPKRVKCQWCGQRIPWEALDCPFCGGYEDEVDDE